MKRFYRAISDISRVGDAISRQTVCGASWKLLRVTKVPYPQPTYSRPASGTASGEMPDPDRGDICAIAPEIYP